MSTEIKEQTLREVYGGILLPKGLDACLKCKRCDTDRYIKNHASLYWQGQYATEFVFDVHCACVDFDVVDPFLIIEWAIGTVTLTEKQQWFLPETTQTTINRETALLKTEDTDWKTTHRRLSDFLLLPVGFEV